MPDETARSRAARAAAEQALIRVVHHYGGRPEFVLLGGLVPDLLCSTSDIRHAGTTDVDVQVDLEIALGSTSARRLERALLNAEFTPDGQRAWRWVAQGPTPRTVVKFELLTEAGAQAGDQVAGSVGTAAAPSRPTTCCCPPCSPTASNVTPTVEVGQWLAPGRLEGGKGWGV